MIKNKRQNYPQFVKVGDVYVCEGLYLVDLHYTEWTPQVMIQGLSCEHASALLNYMAVLQGKNCVGAFPNIDVDSSYLVEFLGQENGLHFFSQNSFTEQLRFTKRPRKHLIEDIKIIPIDAFAKEPEEKVVHSTLDVGIDIVEQSKATVIQDVDEVYILRALSKKMFTVQEAREYCSRGNWRLDLDRFCDYGIINERILGGEAFYEVNPSSHQMKMYLQNKIYTVSTFCQVHPTWVFCLEDFFAILNVWKKRPGCVVLGGLNQLVTDWYLAEVLSYNVNCYLTDLNSKPLGLDPGDQKKFLVKWLPSVETTGPPYLHGKYDSHAYRWYYCDYSPQRPKLTRRLCDIRRGFKFILTVPPPQKVSYIGEDQYPGDGFVDHVYRFSVTSYPLNGMVYKFRKRSELFMQGNLISIGVHSPDNGSFPALKGIVFGIHNGSISYTLDPGKRNTTIGNGGSFEVNLGRTFSHMKTNCIVHRVSTFQVWFTFRSVQPRLFTFGDLMELIPQMG